METCSQVIQTWITEWVVAGGGRGETFRRSCQSSKPQNRSPKTLRLTAIKRPRLDNVGVFFRRTSVIYPTSSFFLKRKNPQLSVKVNEGNLHNNEPQDCKAICWSNRLRTVHSLRKRLGTSQYVIRFISSRSATPSVIVRVNLVIDLSIWVSEAFRKWMGVLLSFILGLTYLRWPCL